MGIREDLDLDKKHFNRFIEMIVYAAKTEMNRSPESEEAVEDKKFEEKVAEAINNKDEVLCDRCHTPMALRTGRFGFKRRLTMIIGNYICGTCGLSLPYKRMVR